MLMIHDPPKMGFNFESVRTEDEKMTMLTTVKISEVLSSNKRHRNTWKKTPIFNNYRPVQCMYLQNEAFFKCMCTENQGAVLISIIYMYFDLINEIFLWRECYFHTILNNIIMYDIVLFSDNSGKWCQGIPEHYNHHKTEMRLISC